MNRRTTWAGILTIGGGVLTFVALCLAKGGAPGPEAFGALGLALTTGAGLIAAADGKPKDPE